MTEFMNDQNFHELTISEKELQDFIVFKGQNILKVANKDVSQSKGKIFANTKANIDDKEYQNNNDEHTLQVNKVSEGFYTCFVCNKYYKSERYMKRHVKLTHDSDYVHEGEKLLFNCFRCNGSFISKLEMQQHIERIHEGEKKFSCSICKFRFFLAPK